MCFGPIKAEKIDGKLLISHALDIIEIDEKKPWIAKKNKYFFKFHVVEEFTAQDSKIHLILPFKADEVEVYTSIREEMREVSERQIPHLQAALLETQAPSPDKTSDYRSVGMKNADYEWIFGEKSELVEILGTDTNDVGEQLLRFMNDEINDTSEIYLTKTKTKLEPSKHWLVSIGLSGSYHRGECFGFFIECKNANAIPFKGGEGGQAPLFYSHESVFNNYKNDDVISPLRFADSVNIAFLQVIIFFPKVLDFISPNYDYRTPFVSSVDKFTSIGSEAEFEDARTFIIFNTEGQKIQSNISWFHTVWQFENRWKSFIDKAWVQVVLVVAAFSTIISAVISLVRLIIDIKLPY